MVDRDGVVAGHISCDQRWSGCRSSDHDLSAQRYLVHGRQHLRTARRGPGEWPLVLPTDHLGSSATDTAVVADAAATTTYGQARGPEHEGREPSFG